MVWKTEGFFSRLPFTEKIIEGDGLTEIDVSDLIAQPHIQGRHQSIMGSVSWRTPQNMGIKRPRFSTRYRQATYCAV